MSTKATTVKGAIEDTNRDLTKPIFVIRSSAIGSGSPGVGLVTVPFTSTSRKEERVQIFYDNSQPFCKMKNLLANYGLVDYDTLSTSRPATDSVSTKGSIADFVQRLREEHLRLENEADSISEQVSMLEQKQDRNIDAMSEVKSLIEFYEDVYEFYEDVYEF